jgi:putative phosphoesterase
MKIAVLSDTHGNYALALKILDLLGDFDRIIHLGDGSDDAEIIEAALERKLFIVSGNCDITGNYPHRSDLEISGKRILITHGDRFHVKSGLAGLCRKAKMERADIVLYGHTHIARIEEIEGILFINPGTLKKSAGRQSMAVLFLENDEACAEIIDAGQIMRVSDSRNPYSSSQAGTSGQ